MLYIKSGASCCAENAENTPKNFTHPHSTNGCSKGPPGNCRNSMVALAGASGYRLHWGLGLWLGLWLGLGSGLGFFFLITMQVLWFRSKSTLVWAWCQDWDPGTSAIR